MKKTRKAFKLLLTMETTEAIDLLRYHHVDIQSLLRTYIENEAATLAKPFPSFKGVTYD